ncbi:DUF2000 domain-containing protein [Pokkaliibacter sp. MBI-7]|uniref:DUF2000 domain-containing protein n=1 Tax=Pokkaliibacter sp. MBI-7 TaxID=3040600 RepID=UPI00244C474A|nr:DUF2000 domain-containing protein [Pokkaliibacter sp. MBI-7]MDH2432352.1 DUF2000 domain-containing protein [Pokkaliibacter sp. MBI-7]
MSHRCVLIINPALPTGLIANTAAVLALGIGKLQPSINGPLITDSEGLLHQGITQLPLPILAADVERLHSLRQQAAELAPDLQVVDFCQEAQTARSYEQYSERLQQDGRRLTYHGLLLFGPKALVTSLSGNLPLLK